MEELLLQLLDIAERHHVTDIHFSILKNDTVITEMRVNGVIRRLKEPECDSAFFRYLMYRAGLDLSDALKPQTGRFEVHTHGRHLALRFALVSSYAITSGVLRILNNVRFLTVETLSTDPLQTHWMKEVTLHRTGLVLFTGPTGSGKTTTLYTILNQVNGKKIFTLEDPVEIVSNQYVQLSINEKRGFSWEDGMKQLMRHDPDIVMIGEIRDEKSASAAVALALTGHLVVSTLHASTCVTALHRMMDLGIKEYQLQDVIQGISCQRLFDTEDGKKTGIYEVMNRKEVLYYLEHQRIPEEHLSLQQKIENAVQNGQITVDQALADLLG